MAETQLQITNASVVTEAPTEQAAAADAAAPPPTLVVSIDVENNGDVPLHVWSTLRAYEYDAAARRLTVRLADSESTLPPGITLISRHVVVPHQVVVEPGARSTIRVKVPAVIRRRVPGRGLGLSFVEEPVGPVDEVNVEVQHSRDPVTPTPAEKAETLLARYRQAGQTTKSVVRVSPDKGR